MAATLCENIVLFEICSALFEREPHNLRQDTPASHRFEGGVGCDVPCVLCTLERESPHPSLTQAHQSSR